MRNEEGSSRGRKRKNRVKTLVDGMHSAALLLGEKFENASKDMVEMVRMEMEKDIQNKTSMANSELVKMQSLSRVERFTAIEKITSESNNVLIFWSLDANEREDWVRFILRSELISDLRNVRYVVISFKCYRMLLLFGYGLAVVWLLNCCLGVVQLLFGYGLAVVWLVTCCLVAVRCCMVVWLQYRCCSAAVQLSVQLLLSSRLPFSH
ncbi:hypothetical protein OSB04_019579 [Centaurea solstitialis]|uniref:Uncharacterized protein n=1 Tax=Centaurea solstitialis TaxID=347529 RepID=A0AA38T426_9ASTR|nr:hypothetical protein OSB04_019579 [Centaurea solstitialis]